MKSPVLWVAAVIAILTAMGGNLRADGATPASDGSLVDFSKDISGELTYDAGATGALDAQSGFLKCTFPAGKGYPGVKFADPSGGWNLTGFTGVDAEVKNTSDNTVKIALRVDGGDNWQDQPWNCESASLPPGETRTIRVTFGQSYGNPGYKISPDHVLRILIFAVDPEAAASITVKSLKASK